MTCIFSDVTECAATSLEEHLIQNSLGGMRTSTDATCADCNGYFGKLEQGLGSYYAILIDTLRPLMPSEFREIQRRTIATDTGAAVTRGAGGVARLSKIFLERQQDGALKAISAPLGTDAAVLQAIWDKHNPGKQFRLREVPLTIISPSGTTQYDFHFAREESLAAFKSLLLVADWQTQTLKTPPWFRSTPITQTRAMVRHGHYTHAVRRRTAPMYNLEQEMDAIFSPARCPFSNRVLVVNDAKADCCFGLIQLCNTMPLGLVLGSRVDANDFSLVYEAGLLKGRAEERSEIVGRALLLASDFRHGEFIIRTKESNDFAFQQIINSLDRELGRASNYTDLNSDDDLKAALMQFGGYSLGMSHEQLARNICEPLLRLRFSKNGLSPDAWEQEMRRIEAAVDVVALVRELEHGEPALAVEHLLAVFRSSVSRFTESGGFPKLLSL